MFILHLFMRKSLKSLPNWVFLRRWPVLSLTEHGTHLPHHMKDQVLLSKNVRAWRETISK